MSNDTCITQLLRILCLYSHGGVTGYNDYLMTDGSIKTMTVLEAEGYVMEIRQELRQSIAEK